MRNPLERLGHNGMLAICALIMVGGLAIYSSGIPLSSLASVAVLLLCPLMHILMMRGHGHGAGNQQSCHQTEKAPAEAIPRINS